MGRRLSITIESIQNGLQPFEDFPGEGQFTYAKAIDPDFLGEDNRASLRKAGLITPVQYQNFATSTLDSQVVALITGPEIENISGREMYVVTRDGQLFSYAVNQNGNVSNETLVATAASDEATSGFYYDNYIYMIGTGVSQSDISRYGPLDNNPTATLTNGVWTSSILGSQTSLARAKLPTAAEAFYPDHWGHVHIDGALYFADSRPTGAIINKIKTNNGVNDGSAYNVLQLPNNVVVTDIESYGTDLVIATSTTSRGGLLGQPATENVDDGPSYLFFWDTISDSFYKQVPIEEYVYVSALKNLGGTIYLWGGSPNGGHAIAYYDGADGIIQIAFLPNGNPPLPSAVDTYANRISWGTWDNLEDNNERGMVYSMGSKDARNNSQAIFCTATTVLGAGQFTQSNIVALGYIPYNSGSQPRLIFAGSGSGGNETIESNETGSVGAISSNIQFGAYNIGEPFRIDKVRIIRSGLGGNLTSSTTITPKFQIDDRTKTYELPPIATSNPNFSPSQRNYVYKNPELTELSGGETIHGENSFIFELDFSGTEVVSIKFPITIELTTIDD